MKEIELSDSLPIPDGYRGYPVSDRIRFDHSTKRWVKNCYSCEEDKPFDSFPRTKKSKNGAYYHLTNVRCYDCQKLPPNCSYISGVLSRSCNGCHIDQPLDSYPIRVRTNKPIKLCLDCHQKSTDTLKEALIIDGIEIKYCTTCKIYKPLSEFREFIKKDHSGKPCHSTICLECTPTEKLCLSCGDVKSLNEFHRTHYGRSYNSYCKRCQHSGIRSNGKKTCKKCNIIKSLDQFYPTSKGGYINTCIDCTDRIHGVADIHNLRLCHGKEWKPIKEFLMYKKTEVRTRYCVNCTKDCNKNG